MQQGLQRFQKHGLIGGAIGGVASAIPVLNVLNGCFCILVAAGAVMGVKMYLDEHPGEMLSDADGATIGAIAGAVAGVISGVVGMIFSLALASVFASIYAAIPGAGGMMAGSLMGAIWRIPMAIVVMGGFGALYGFLSMQLFFKDRRRA